MIFGALSVLLIIVALAILIIPVLKTPSQTDSLARDQQNIRIAREKKQTLEDQLANGQMTQAEFDAAMVDLETSLALDLERQQALDSNQQSGQWAVWVMAVIVPLLSILMYIELGEYRVVDDPSLRGAGAQAQAQAQPQLPEELKKKVGSIDEMIEKVKNRLREQPDDYRGWFVLGRTYMSMQKYPEAVTALQRSYDLNKEQPDIMLSLADSLAMVRDGNMLGEPERLVQEALAISPNELTGLWLGGLAAEQGGRLSAAFDYFARLLPMLSKDSRSTEEVKNMLVALKERQPDLPELDFDKLSMPPAHPPIAPPAGKHPPIPAPGQQQSIATGASVQLSISLAPQFQMGANPDDLLFVYAKAASGPPMPLAAKRLKVSDLPLQLTLTDGDAMMPQMSLSKFDQIIVGARISKSGNPVAQSGDLFGESGVISQKSNTGVLNLNIDQIK